MYEISGRKIAIVDESHFLFDFGAGHAVDQRRCFHVRGRAFWEALIAQLGGEYSLASGLLSHKAADPMLYPIVSAATSSTNVDRLNGLLSGRGI